MRTILVVTRIFSVPATFAQSFHHLGPITLNAYGPGIRSDGIGGRSTTSSSKAARFEGI
jgi:hypothetical protein